MNSETRGTSGTGETSENRLVSLVYLVSLVCLVERDEPDEPVPPILLGCLTDRIASTPMLGFGPMCGRFTQTTTPEALAQQFDVHHFPLLTPRYNIAPSQSVAAIRIDPETTTRLGWGSAGESAESWVLSAARKCWVADWQEQWHAMPTGGSGRTTVTLLVKRPFPTVRG